MYEWAATRRTAWWLTLPRGFFLSGALPEVGEGGGVRIAEVSLEPMAGAVCEAFLCRSRHCEKSSSACSAGGGRQKPVLYILLIPYDLIAAHQAHLPLMAVSCRYWRRSWQTALCGHESRGRTARKSRLLLPVQSNTPCRERHVRIEPSFDSWLRAPLTRAGALDLSTFMP